MGMPDFLKKKISDGESESASESESESSSGGSESESESDAPPAAKKGAKMNPLMAWAAKNKR